MIVLVVIAVVVIVAILVAVLLHGAGAPNPNGMSGITVASL